ncbi:MAG: hypothetical protein DBY35_06515 [Bacteroidales bacterium]|nr:MAG: hypothetical protein DBY35_06515 [Bacteroidales bacterium]
MKHNSLPGITAIRAVRCSDLLPNAMLRSIAGALIAIAAPSVTVSFHGIPALTWEGTTVNGSRQEKATLRFDTTEPLPEGERLAFVVTCASGEQYLLGTREPRFPVVEYSETTGKPGGDPAVRSYTVTHTAQKSVLRCIL